jgi:hypothetical protein
LAVDTGVNVATDVDVNVDMDGGEETADVSPTPGTEMAQLAEMPRQHHG